MIGLLPLLALRPDPVARAFSLTAQAVIAHPERTTIYAVEPGLRPSLYGFRGAVAARSLSPAEGHRATDALFADLRSASPADTMSCFEPHHGLRFSRGRQWVAVWICYQCHRVQVEESGGREAMLPIGRAGRSVLDGLLPKGRSNPKGGHAST